MQIPVEPNLDKPVPAQAQPQTGRTYEDRLKVAGNTAMLLKELGADDDLSDAERDQARQMIEKLKPADSKPSLPSEEEGNTKNYNVSLAIGTYLNEYEKQIVADKVQVRTVVVNRLMEISKNEDDKIALKALELLGKASDLFTERSEITFENEFVNLAALSLLEKRGVCFRPQLSALAPVLDKYEQRCYFKDRKSTRLNSSHSRASRMPSSA